MKRRENNVKSSFSTIVLCMLAILLLTAPVLCADETVPLGQTKNINYPVTGMLFIYGTANLLTGASVTQSIYVQEGGTLNMYSGSVGWFVSIATNNSTATVYGTNFGGDGDFSVPGQVSFPTNGSGTLTGNYGDGSDISLLFLSDTPIYLAPPEIGVEQVEIDIKPGSDPNPINQGSNGLIPVAIFSSPEFDATQVDPTSVSLAGASVAVRGKGKSMAHEEDVNGNGLVDLVVQVETQGFDDLGAGGTVELTGTTFGGEAIVGYDEVVIVPPE